MAVIGAVKVKDLSPLHVEALLDTYREKVSGTTLHHTFCTLKAAINRGIRWRLAPPENPCKGVDAPKRSTKRPEPFSITEVGRLRRRA